MQLLCLCIAVGRIANHKLAAYQLALVHVLQCQLKDQRLEPNTDLLTVLGLADNPDLKVLCPPFSPPDCRSVLSGRLSKQYKKN